MKPKTSLFLGFFVSIVAFSFWQAEFINRLFLVLRQERHIISPLGKMSIQKPQVLGEITTIENTWDFGQIRTEEKILASGAVVWDLTNNKLIYEKDSHLHLQAASTIKILTAAVGLDKGKLDEEITVNYFPTVVGESSMYLGFGEKFTLEELLYGMLLVSGNDAAETIAQGLAGKRETYISWMNDFCQKIGALDTRFTTPSGLDEDGQYTSAWDLYLMGKHIFNNYPEILKISTTREKYLPKTNGHKAYLLRNKLLLLDDFPILGGKPGLGEQGMLSLVALLEKNNHKILVTLIRTPSLRHDLTQIEKLL